jgi:hypothetical protein
MWPSIATAGETFADRCDRRLSLIDKNHKRLRLLNRHARHEAGHDQSQMD